MAEAKPASPAGELITAAAKLRPFRTQYVSEAPVLERLADLTHVHGPWGAAVAVFGPRAVSGSGREVPRGPLESTLSLPEGDSLPA